MLDDQIRLEKPLLITSKQKEEYLEDGAVLIKNIVSEKWLKRIRSASNEIIERSREIEESNSQYILEEGHSKNNPRLKRLSSPVDHHSTFWDFISSEMSSQLAADVVGPNVKYHHSKLNYKWANGGTEFDWHQDIQSWPHTDYSPVTLGLFLYDCTSDQGPMLLSVYSSADSMPYTSNPIPSPYCGTIVRGKRAVWASHDPRPCQLPPEWSKGYIGPWAHQDQNKMRGDLI